MICYYPGMSWDQRLRTAAGQVPRREAAALLLKSGWTRRRGRWRRPGGRLMPMASALLEEAERRLEEGHRQHACD